MEKSTRAANGIEIFSYKNPALHGFQISLFLRAGSMYEESSECGITHFLEHVLVRNVNKLSGGKLYGELDARGMEFNASTYSEMVQFYVLGASCNFSVGADIVSNLLKPIILSPGEIDTERKRIKAEIRESDEKNSLSGIAARTVFEGTSLAASILGTNKSVDKISAARLEKYRRRAFTSENVFLYVTGNFEDADIDALAKLIGSADILSGGAPRNNTAPVPIPFGKRDGLPRVKNSDYTMVRFAFDIDMGRVSCPEVDLLYDMLLSGYNSPFFIEMSEERGLFYDITGATERYKNIGTLYFSYEVKEKNLYDALEMTVKILNDFKVRLHGEGECMKAGYVTNAYLLFDDAREFNFTFAYDNHIMDLGYASLEDRITAYKNVTPERISAVACEIFTPANLSLILKGNKKRIDLARIQNVINCLQ